MPRASFTLGFQKIRCCDYNTVSQVHAGRHILTVNDVFDVLPVPALSFRQWPKYGRLHHGSEDRGEIASTEHSD